ncbi:MAG: hypothetical protein D3910_15635, partial [Candidatus Electrothrix sp. ATG2]|nr:hypothetical protein [Candidatus Electrothrix sp. ATG2]
RIVADVQAGKQDVADLLIKKGLAVRYDGGTKGFDWCSSRAKRMRKSGQKGGRAWVDLFEKVLK